MAALPLAAASVDAVVFCLALMPTDWPAGVREAARVLRHRGALLVAEVRSRFAAAPGAGAQAPPARAGGKRPRDASPAPAPAPGAGADAAGVRAFTRVVEAAGFALERTEDDNAMFVIFHFRRVGGGEAAAQGAVPALPLARVAAAAPAPGAALPPPQASAVERDAGRSGGGSGAAADAGGKHRRRRASRAEKLARAGAAAAPLRAAAAAPLPGADALKACIYKRR
jgi:hypothetical protein